jgi:hypothetical protein
MPDEWLEEHAVSYRSPHAPPSTPPGGHHFHSVADIQLNLNEIGGAIAIPEYR